MECPDGSICFRTENFGIIVFVLFLIAFYVYYQMGKKITKKTMKKEKLHQKILELERLIEQLNLQLVNTSKKEQKVIQETIQRKEDEKQKYYKRLVDPLEVPNQTYEFTEDIYKNVQNYTPKQMVNIPTRGVPTDFQPIGILTNKDTTKHPNILQLFGRPLWIGSNKWQYYTSSDNYQSIKIQIIHKRMQCLSDIGCEELYSGDEVHVPAYGMSFRVELYRLDKPSYIPFLM